MVGHGIFHLCPFIKIKITCICKHTLKTPYIQVFFFNIEYYTYNFNDKTLISEIQEIYS